ncbi:hypothetical protein VNO77_34024 [Canavalia gladiata]|uniref:Uncharacterized protein n=1 Tax=Canavalia gladiata TaxID=3824 RepID=A0AAN9KCY9_CANGL
MGTDNRTPDANENGLFGTSLLIQAVIKISGRLFCSKLGEMEQVDLTANGSYRSIPARSMAAFICYLKIYLLDTSINGHETRKWKGPQKHRIGVQYLVFYYSGRLTLFLEENGFVSSSH